MEENESNLVHVVDFEIVGLNGLVKTTAYAGNVDGG